MARLSPVKRIVAEDFPDQRSWIGKLLQPLNQVFEFIATTFNRGITFTDHIACQIKEVSVLNDANAYPIKFQNTLKTKPFSVMIARASEDETSPATITNALWPAWELNQSNEIQINNISGLTANKKYKITLLVM